MRDSLWYKFIAFIGLVVIVAGVSLSVYMYLDYEADRAVEEGLEEYISTQVPDDIVIDVPEPCTEGHLTVFSDEGITYFQYSGDILIENDGKNGQPIQISIYVPEESSTYTLP